ncbi:MAG: hypothetical protein RBR71_07295 [Gudongella sp.]|nr:hypothetical protein [Gudongella sp.]
MKNEKSKMIKIMNELVRFYLRSGNNHVSVDLDITDVEGTITLRGCCTRLKQDTIIELDRIINSPRKDETEEYYWNLMGTSDFSEIRLLGSLVNDGSVKYEGDTLVIKVRRKF